MDSRQAEKTPDLLLSRGLHAAAGGGAGFACQDVKLTAPPRPSVVAQRRTPFLRSMTMVLRTYTPGPPLDEYIDRFWLCSDTPAHPRERILPSGSIELVINLSDDEIRIYDPAHPDRRSAVFRGG